jgi:hypothetical protein
MSPATLPAAEGRKDDEKKFCLIHMFFFAQRAKRRSLTAIDFSVLHAESAALPPWDIPQATTSHRQHNVPQHGACSAADK